MSSVSVWKSDASVLAQLGMVHSVRHGKLRIGRCHDIGELSDDPVRRS
jgi:hypothetical protein